MAQSEDPGHFFQTTDSLATIQRKATKSKNKNGNPLDLKSKILALTPDLDNAQGVFVAEAGGVVRRLDLETSTTKATYFGANAPLTSVTVSTSDPNNRILFASCWDKSIHSWSINTRKPIRRYTGHTDFVKCVLVATLEDTEVLISGSTDASIIVWDIATGRKIHTVKGHARGILDLAIDPASTDGLVVFAADSARDIRRWRITGTSMEEVAPDPIAVHQTSVNRLCFEDGDADLWTASSDKTALHLVRTRNWEADTVLEHPDYVRDVVVSADGRWVVTACRDEEVRVWDASSGKVACVYSGHYEEVMGLALVDGGRSVVSVSIDGTVRRWSLDAADIAKTREEADQATDGAVEAEEVVETKTGVLTAEEEAELAELMDSDDE